MGDVISIKNYNDKNMYSTKIGDNCYDIDDDTRVVLGIIKLKNGKYTFDYCDEIGSNTFETLLNILSSNLDIKEFIIDIEHEIDVDEEMVDEGVDHFNHYTLILKSVDNQPLYSMQFTQWCWKDGSNDVPSFVKLRCIKDKESELFNPLIDIEKEEMPNYFVNPVLDTLTEIFDDCQLVLNIEEEI